MSPDEMTAKVWRRQDEDRVYLASTSPDLLDQSFINTAFGSDEMFWAKPLEPEQLALMLSQSVTIGLYMALSGSTVPALVVAPSSPRSHSLTLEAESHERLQQIGLARFITDRVSTAYLTDVYVLPEYRQQGLGKWLIACCREILQEHPALRRAFLVTSPDVGRTFYARELGFWDIREEHERLVCMTKRTFM